MKNLPKNSKINLFKKTWASAQEDAKSANKKALESGKILSELKEENKGCWTKFVETELDGFIGIRQADKLIKCYENKLLISLVSNNEKLTINEMLQIISEATPEQIAQFEQLKKDEADRIALAETNKALAEAKAAIDNAKKQDDVIDGVFEEVGSGRTSTDVIYCPECDHENYGDAENCRMCNYYFKDYEDYSESKQEIKPEIEPEPEEDPEALLLNIVNDQEKMLKELISENESLTKAFESNDPLMQALEDLRRTKEISKGFEDRMQGLQNERMHLMKEVKYWRSKYEKLEKANASA